MCRRPEGVVGSERFWIKAQVGGTQPALIYDQTRTCNFYLGPNAAGYNELKLSVSKQPVWGGMKSYYEAAFLGNDKTPTVYLNTSTAISEW